MFAVLDDTRKQVDGQRPTGAGSLPTRAEARTRSRAVAAALVEKNPSLTSSELAARLGRSRFAIARDMRALGLGTVRRRNLVERMKKRVRILQRAYKKNPNLTVAEAARALKTSVNVAIKTMRAAGISRGGTTDGQIANAASAYELAQRMREALDDDPELGAKKLARALGCSQRCAYRSLQAARVPSYAMRGARDLIAFRRAEAIVAAQPHIQPGRLAEMIGTTKLKASAYLCALGRQETALDRARRLLDEETRKRGDGAMLNATIQELANKFDAPEWLVSQVARELGVATVRDAGWAAQFDGDMEKRAAPLPQSALDEILRLDPDCDPPFLPPDCQERYLQIREARLSGKRKVVARID